MNIPVRTWLSGGRVFGLGVILLALATLLGAWYGLYLGVNDLVDDPAPEIRTIHIRFISEWPEPDSTNTFKIEQMDYQPRKESKSAKQE